MPSEDELEGLGLADETVKKLKRNGIQSKSDLKLLSENEKAMKEEVWLSVGECLRVKDVVKREFPGSTSDQDEAFDWRDTVRDKLHFMFKYEVKTILTPLTLFLNSDEALPDWKAFSVILKDDWAFEQYAKKLADDLRNGRRSLKEIDKYSIEVGAIIAYGFAGMARAWGKLPAVVQEQFLELANQIWVVQKLLDSVNKIGGERLFSLWNAIYGGYQTMKNVWKFKKGEIDGVTCANNIVKVWLTTLGGWVGGFAGAAAGAVVCGTVGVLAESHGVVAGSVGVVAGSVGALVGGAAGAMAGAYSGAKLAERLTENIFSGSFESALKKAWRVLGDPEHHTMEAAKTRYENATKKIIHGMFLDSKIRACELDTALAVVEASFINDGA